MVRSQSVCSRQGVFLRISARAIVLFATCFAACAAIGRAVSTRQKATAATVRSTSTLVTVPVLARSATGEFVHNLDASRFQLLDNGVSQDIKAEYTKNQSIALVILMQTGGAGFRQLQTYVKLPVLVRSIAGDSPHEIMFATFDSRIEEIWHFPLRSDGVDHALTHPHAGDNGAAIIDAVKFGVDQLQQEPGNFRRIILLISQLSDSGSNTSPQAAIRALGEGSTIVYSLAFPSSKPKRKRKSRQTREHVNRFQSPLGAAERAMRLNTAAEIALLTGGEQFRFSGMPDFNSKSLSVEADIRNGNSLTFQPTSHKAGFHTLTVRIAGAHSHIHVTARASYWFEPGNSTTE